MKHRAANTFRIFSCIVVLGAFLWHTGGSSFLPVEQQKHLSSKTTSKTGTEKNGNPFENATEEQTETSPTSFAGEYLKEDTEHFLQTDIPLKHNKFHFEKAFQAIYRESVSQPPEINFC